MTRNRILVPFLLATLALVLATPATAQMLPEVSAEASVYSKYVWRGLVVTDGPVLQPAATAGLGGASVGIWANTDLDDANARAGEITEVDLWLEYGLALGLVDLTAGLVHYGYPDAEGDTSELYAIGSAALPLSPTLSLYRDLDAVEGWYVGLALAHGLVLGPEHTLDLTASVGAGDENHNQAYYLGTGGGPADASLAASWTWSPVPRLSVTPQLAWVTLLGDASDAMDMAGGETSAVVLGITAGFAF